MFLRRALSDVGRRPARQKPARRPLAIGALSADDRGDGPALVENGCAFQPDHASLAARPAKSSPVPSYALEAGCSEVVGLQKAHRVWCRIPWFMTKCEVREPGSTHLADRAAATVDDVSLYLSYLASRSNRSAKPPPGARFRNPLGAADRARRLSV